MKTINFILSWIQEEASQHDRARIKELITALECPTLNAGEFVERVLHTAKQMYTGNNRLEVVKYIKGLTGWGLKEIKEWCDKNIFNEKHIQDEQGNSERLHRY